MSRVCMVRPPRGISSGTFTAGASIPPLGLAYLNASLESAGLDVFAIDAIGEAIDQFYKLNDVPDISVQGMYFEDIVARIPEDTFLIGISCMFSAEWFLYEALIECIKNSFPGIPIVVGGEHVTAEAHNVLKTCKAVDICVSGEGEVTLVELAQALKEGKDWKGIDGISYRKDKEIVKNKSRSRIKELDTIPSPSWKNIPVHRYHDKGYSMTTMFRPSMPVIASRGCPFRCTFCSSPQMWGTNLILRSPRLVIEEIKKYKTDYNITHIDFIDIVGVLHKDWIKELLTLMIEADLGITWIYGSGTRSEILDNDVLDLFKKSNVLRVFYAPESGSETTIKRIKKRVNLEKMTKSMRYAQKLGISMHAPLIYGFPDQTLKEAFENVIFSFKLAALGVDDVVGHAFAAYPGSELYNDLQKSGHINTDELIVSGKYRLFLAGTSTAKIRNLSSWSEHIPDWSLPLFQYGVMALTYLVSFLFHPGKILRTINNIFIKRKPLTLLEHVIYDRIVASRVRVNSEPRTLNNYIKSSSEVKPSSAIEKLPQAV